MRLLLLIMTGIGFTLGLLCGLLLQLPADGLPANSDHIIIHATSSDQNFRWKRSLREDNPSQGSSLSSDVDRWAGSRFVVPFMPSDNRKSQSRPSSDLIGRESSRAEPSETGKKKGDEELSTAASAVFRPVTSFTLRLKNIGSKLVVQSAVERQEENDKMAPGGPAPVIKTFPQADVTNVSSSSKAYNDSWQLSDIVSGVIWSRKLEDSCPGEFEPKELAAWRRKARKLQVVGLKEGCGRMQNRLVIFKDGTQACARYRLNTDQLQGEVYSYYLAQLLNISNMPPTILQPVDTLSPQWKSVHLQMSRAQWADGRAIVLTRWLDDLVPSYIPPELRPDDRKLQPTLGILGKKSVSELCDLLQWSDLIVFDYLTANLDRLVNNMFNKQWNADMMNNPAHNLERTKRGNLVFLDNESGLFHGYRLLEKYHGYHDSLLNSLCVFRESTARAVKVLHKSKSVGEELHKLFSEGEVHHKHLPSIPEKNIGVLKERLSRVYDQIVRCEAMYGR